MSLRPASAVKPLRALLTATLLGGSTLLPACGVLGTSGPSSVAQGKYFSTANPQYDEFFLAIYELQTSLAEAPRAPEAERQALTQAVGLTSDAPETTLAARLHESPQKVGHTQIVASAANLRRSLGDMQAASGRLAQLEVSAAGLTSNVDVTFGAGKRSVVKKNLADAQKLIALMNARATEVSRQDEQLLHALPSETPVSVVETETAKPQNDPGKKPPVDAKKQLKSAPASHAAASAPKPPHPSAEPGEGAPEKPKAPNKPAPPPRDFEP